MRSPCSLCSLCSPCSPYTPAIRTIRTAVPRAWVVPDEEPTPTDPQGELRWFAAPPRPTSDLLFSPSAAKSAAAARTSTAPGRGARVAFSCAKPPPRVPHVGLVPDEEPTPTDPQGELRWFAAPPRLTSDPLFSPSAAKSAAAARTEKNVFISSLSPGCLSLGKPGPALRKRQPSAGFEKPPWGRFFNRHLRVACRQANQGRPYEKCAPGPAFQSRLGIGHRKNRTGGNSPNHARAKVTLSSTAWFEMGVTFPQIRLGVALPRLVLREV